MVSGLLKRLASLRYLKYTQDSILFGKDRIAFYFLPQLAKEFVYERSVNGLDYCIASFLASKSNGMNFVKSHVTSFQKDLAHVVDMSCEALNAFGWGTFKTLKVREDEPFILIKGETSNLAEEIKTQYGSQKDPVDFALSGIFSGAFQAYSRKKVYVVELNCKSQRNVRNCSFIGGTEANIKVFVEENTPDLQKYIDSLFMSIHDLEKRVRITLNEQV